MQPSFWLYLDTSRSKHLHCRIQRRNRCDGVGSFGLPSEAEKFRLTSITAWNSSPHIPFLSQGRPMGMLLGCRRQGKMTWESDIIECLCESWYFKFPYICISIGVPTLCRRKTRSRGVNPPWSHREYITTLQFKVHLSPLSHITFPLPTSGRESRSRWNREAFCMKLFFPRSVGTELNFQAPRLSLQNPSCSWGLLPLEIFCSKKLPFLLKRSEKVWAEAL